MASFDFTGISGPAKRSKPTDPEEIWAKLPRLPTTLNDLWRGQADALGEWHKNRTSGDILISLNTGAGKTVVGLLIAQSLVNEKIDNVVYCCSTKDLVLQTYNESKKLGLNFTTRIDGSFNNDLFDDGLSPCITTYHAMFNFRSIFNSKYRPGAIIFDDAHVAESIIRESYTLRILHMENSECFNEVYKILFPSFEEHHLSETLKDVVTGKSSIVLMAPPETGYIYKNQILQALRKHGIDTKKETIWSFNLIKDHINLCTITISRGTIELSPPFIPSKSIQNLTSKSVRRVYLSATLRQVADFSRAFGNTPDCVIEPTNDAGNGERLVLFSRKFSQTKVSDKLVIKLLEKHKVLIATPSKIAADTWGSFGSPPPSNEFTERLDSFRKADKGCFVLVSRVDGIDLPNNTCRIMIIDGLPIGSTQLEKFQWQSLYMHNLYAGRLATRITQLFGRINRGRNDFGVFIIDGNDINSWLRKERNYALLPDILSKQIRVGLTVQEGLRVKATDEVAGLIEQVLDRDEGWLNFYQDSLDSLDEETEVSEQARKDEDIFAKIAVAESSAMGAMWLGMYPQARRHLEEIVQEASFADEKQAGWLNLWIGLCLYLEGDTENAAYEFQRSRARLGANILVPNLHVTDDKDTNFQTLTTDNHPFVQAVCNKSERHLKRYTTDLENISAHLLDFSSTVKIKEEAVRNLGELLGFDAKRPDNELQEGPDVLWINHIEKHMLPIELKTEKQSGGTLKKEDVGQAFDNIEWLKSAYPDYRFDTFLFLSPTHHCTNMSHPTEQMVAVHPEKIAAFALKISAMALDAKKIAPKSQRAHADSLICGDSLSLVGIVEQLAAIPISKKS